MRLLLTLAAATAFAAAPAAARVVMVGPNPCPVPADAAPYLAPAEISAVDPDDWRRAARRGPVTVDVVIDIAADAVVFRRFRVDPERPGLAFYEEREQACGGGSEIDMADPFGLR